MKAMAKNPKDRYQTTKELDEDLCRWLDNVPVKAMHVTPIQKFFQWIGRHLATAIMAPVVIISVIMMAVFIIKYDRSHNASASIEARRIALEDEVDLTEQDCINFRGGYNVEVKEVQRFTGGKNISCMIKSGSEKQQGTLEILAPSESTWDVTKRRRLSFFVFEEDDKGTFFLPLDNIKIRLGRGSSYFEYQPAKSESDWWSQRKYNNWWPYVVPLEGSEKWQRTISGNPQFENIDWIEFHFEAMPRKFKFSIDDIKFLNDPYDPAKTNN
jgi:hypothetical protein